MQNGLAQLREHLSHLWAAHDSFYHEFCMIYKTQPDTQPSGADIEPLKKDLNAVAQRLKSIELQLLFPKEEVKQANAALHAETRVGQSEVHPHLIEARMSSLSKDVTAIAHRLQALEELLLLRGSEKMDRPPSKSPRSNRNGKPLRVS